MKVKLIKYGKIFATKVANTATLPVDDEITGLNTLEKGRGTYSLQAHEFAPNSPKTAGNRVIEFARCIPRID